jgi:hypothetical protein
VAAEAQGDSKGGNTQPHAPSDNEYILVHNQRASGCRWTPTTSTKIGDGCEHKFQRTLTTEVEAWREQQLDAEILVFPPCDRRRLCYFAIKGSKSALGSRDLEGANAGPPWLLGRLKCALPGWEEAESWRAADTAPESARGQLQVAREWVGRRWGAQWGGGRPCVCAGRFGNAVSEPVYSRARRPAVMERSRTKSA